VSGGIAIVAAVARNGAIGADGGLPWRLSSDLKRFRALTLGKPLIMGRKTFESVGRPLPGRRVIVVTRDPGWVRPDVEVAHGLDEALALARGVEEIMIGGGAEIYALALPYVDRLYLTEVEAEPQGNVFFPRFDRARWRETRREMGLAGPKDDHPFVFVDYERV
jgi:dihydrofolate reductase